MIYNSNTTALGANTIPVAEGYDTSCGASLILVEAARNDLAMFRVMLNADYKEMAICKESTGVVMEGELSALHEAVGGGIFKKIADFFRKLWSKIKSIFSNFTARFLGLLGKDEELVKKYMAKTQRKTNIDKLEVKWRKEKGGVEPAVLVERVEKLQSASLKDMWAEDQWGRVSNVIGAIYPELKNCENESELKEGLISLVLEDEDTATIGEIGGIKALADFIKAYKKAYAKMKSAYDKVNRFFEKVVKDYDKQADNAAKNDGDVSTANKEYDVAVAAQIVITTTCNTALTLMTTMYKYSKAAFIKAATVNPDKIEESLIYAEAVAEAAEQEVEDVITGALSDSELEDLSAASVDVKDADVSDDPNELTCGSDCHTEEVPADAEGTVDTDVNSKNEAAFFGAMFF